MSPPVQVFGRRQRGASHARWRAAAEKRQGTKSRRRVARVASPRAQYALGGFRHQADAAEQDARRSACK